MAAVNGSDATTKPSASKQQLRSSNNGKSLDGARKQSASPVDGQNKRQQQPKAWQGPNPITQRASTNIPNGTEKPLSKTSPQSQQMKSSGDLQADKHAHDRSIFLLAQFTGKDATITLRNGEQFSGVFSGGSFESPKYILKMARRTRLPSHQQVNGTTELPHEYVGEDEDHVMSFEIQDTVDLFVEDVTTTAASHQNGSSAPSFLTDTQITSRESLLPRQRELQRWEPGPESMVDMSLGNPKDTEWDQFSTNERMYGVRSTYDENIYTTSIDRSNPEYRRREAEADRIAREIECSAPADAHIAEERRRDANRDDVDGDEEAKYSGVKREAVALPKRAAGAYVPPSQRPMTGLPTVTGAPFDPAIISTQLAKPTPPAATQNQVAPPVGLPSGPVEQAVPTTIQGPVQAALPKRSEDMTAKRYIEDTVDAFKEFANTEKLRVRQAQEMKRSTARTERNVKLNDLRKFAANFKLKSRVPDDLVPILAKSRDKQMEIQAKADVAAKEEEKRSKDKPSEKTSSVTSPPPIVKTPPPGPASVVDPRSMFNNNNNNLHTSRFRVLQQPRGASANVQNTSPQAARFQGGPFRTGGHIPNQLRIPPGGHPSSDSPMSPASATKLNVKAFEFRPSAHTFNPTDNSRSPQRSTGSGLNASPTRAPALYIGKNKSKDCKAFASAFDPLKRMAEADYNDAEKKRFTPNGGLPQAYNTPPTWQTTKGNDALSYLAYFPKVQTPGQGPSPMQTPHPNGSMPHAHQLPAHMQGPPMSTPHRQPYYPQPAQHSHAPSFDPRLQHFGPNGSVQNSPRQQMQAVPFNAQMTPMQMQPFPGQPIPGFGVSPSMPYRQPAVQNGMMMMPGQQGQMGPMQPGFPPGPQFRGPQMGGQIGGHMMVQQQSGGYMNGPMPQQGYSPMPQHPQPHMAHMPPHGGPTGYSGSPRPPMMQHQGSHQGYQPGMPLPHFAPSPGHPNPYQFQQRAMSGGFPQMTPRQQHAVPNHSSPGMPGVGQGDEGK